MKIKTPNNRYLFVLSSVFFALTLFVSQGNSSNGTPQAQSLIEQLAEQNMKTFPWKEAWTDPSSFEEFINSALDVVTNPSEQHRRHLAFEFYEKFDTAAESTPSCLFSTKPWQELEFFKGKSGSSRYLGSVIDRTQSELGRIALFKLIAHPIADVARIKERQNIIKTLVSDEKTFNELKQQLTLFKQHEGSFLAWWDKNPLKQASRHCYFVNALAKPLNDYSLALDGVSVYDRGLKLFVGAKTALAATVLISYGFLKLFDKSPDLLTNQADRLRPGGFVVKNLWRLDNNIIKGITSIIAGLICGSCSHEYFTRLQTHLMIERAIHIIMGKIAHALDIVKACNDLVAKNPDLKDRSEFKKLAAFFELLDQQTPEIKEFITHLESDELHGEPSGFWLHGSTLRAYRLADKVKEHLAPLLASMGQLDAYVSLAQLYQEFLPQQNCFTFVEFEENASNPRLDITNSWLPLLDDEYIASHSLELGGKKPELHAIITGPDGGGKSTALKEVATAVMMAQSIGLAPAQKMCLTPFETIETHFGGHKSQSLKSSQDRIEVFFEQVQKRSPLAFHLLVCDTPFASASHLLAEQLSRRLVETLENQQNCISLMTTHFGRVTMHAEKSNFFVNFKISAHEDPQQAFKLEQGTSNKDVIFLH